MTDHELTPTSTTFGKCICEEELTVYYRKSDGVKFFYCKSCETWYANKEIVIEIEDEDLIKELNEMI